jgi:hypothetical protein
MYAFAFNSLQIPITLSVPCKSFARGVAEETIVSVFIPK